MAAKQQNQALCRLTFTMLPISDSSATEPLESICNASVERRFTNAKTRDVGT